MLLRFLLLSLIPGPLWPWLALIGLGLFHGVNPAMGWLFSVALGLHRHSRKIVALSWIPIALGHAAAIALVLFAVLALGIVLDHAALSRAAAAWFRAAWFRMRPRASTVNSTSATAAAWPSAIGIQDSATILRLCRCSPRATLNSHPIAGLTP